MAEMSGWWREGRGFNVDSVCSAALGFNMASPDDAVITDENGLFMVGSMEISGWACMSLGTTLGAPVLSVVSTRGMWFCVHDIWGRP